MWEIIQSLFDCFPKGSLIHTGEFVAEPKANAYFHLLACETEKDVQCKVLEWFSREAYKSRPFRSAKTNDEYNKYMLDGINRFLGTDFSAADMEEIYTYLGNAIRHNATMAFIDTGFNMTAIEGICVGRNSK